MQLQLDKDGRIDVPVELVHQLIDSQFPQWTHFPISPVERKGWDNHTFRLGDELLARLPSAERYAAQVEKEQYWLPRLAGGLTIAVPEMLALGRPGCGYPWSWSVRRWIEGETAAGAGFAHQHGLALELVGFLGELWSIDTAGGPVAGPHNFQRGGLLATYDGETRAALAALGSRVDAEKALDLWQRALCSPFVSKQCWLHGDLYPGNILLQEGRLHAVIDWGCLGVGDPACDLAVAWTVLLDQTAREAFRSRLGIDDELWLRGRGWTLWKVLTLLAGYSCDPPEQCVEQNRILAAVMSD